MPQGLLWGDAVCHGVMCCDVLQELMAEQGSHRPAALKCGHIFGEGCIRRWLREKTRCPQCNKQ